MDDNTILERGGTERDITEYAKQNGADMDDVTHDKRVEEAEDRDADIAQEVEEGIEIDAGDEE